MQVGKLFSVTVWACILHVRLAFMQITTRKAICSIREASKLAEISVVGGCGGIVLLLANRLMGLDSVVSDIQSRADIISMIACSGLLLNAFSEQDIIARDRDPVALLGFALREPFIASNVSEELKAKFLWISNAILRNTPCTSVHIFKKKEKEGVILLSQAGVVSADPLKFPPSLPTKQPILQGIISEAEREVYLPDLQILPGKIEFTYLPLNCQSVLMLAAGEYIIVVGTNQAKVLKQEDLTRIRTLSYILKEIV